MNWIDPLSNFVAALLGGGFTLLGGWLAVRWQSAHEAKSIAAALLSELSAADNIMRRGNVDRFYRDTLDHWKETGTVHDRQSLKDMFGSDPQDALPVYYSMASKLGLLPQALAADIVEYHAFVVGLNRILAGFIGGRDLPPEVVKAVAFSIESQWDTITKLRAKLISELDRFVTD